MKEYSETIQLATYDVGVKNKLRLSSLMRYCQEISERHLGVYGLPYEKLKADGLVFVFTRAQIKIHNLPVHRETIRMTTRACGVVGAQFYREFEVWRGEELMVEVLEASALVSAREHRLLRPKAFSRYGISAGENSGQRLGRIAMPKDAPQVGERMVRYSDLDYNGHLNNAIYCDIFCDFVPGGMMGRNLVDFQIHFVLETRLGENLKIYAKEEDGAVYLGGDNPRGDSFVCRAVFE